MLYDQAMFLKRWKQCWVEIVWYLFASDALWIDLEIYILVIYIIQYYGWKLIELDMDNL